MQEWDYGRLPCRSSSMVWGSQRELAFIWSHKTKELPVTSRGPPTATLDGGWGVRKWQSVCTGGEGGSSGRDSTESDRQRGTDLKS